MLAMMFDRRRAVGALTLTIVSTVTAGLAILVGPAASPAAAHAVVIDTSPGPGALLDEPPDRVTISFDEPVIVEADSIVVIDAAGAVVSGAATSSGTDMSAPVDPVATGWHAVSWWAESADGHPVSGAWTFRIGAGADTAPDDLEDRAAAAVIPGRATRWTYTVVQWASALTAVLAVGTIFSMLVLNHRAALAPVATSASASGAALALATAAINGPFSAVSRSWFEGPASNHYLGRAGLLAAVTLVLLVLRPPPDGGTKPRRSPPSVLGLIPLVLAAIALCLPVLVGHTRTAGPASTIGVMSHLVIGAAWLGGVPAVLLLVRSGAPARPILATFSRAATWLLALTLVAGTTSAALLTGGPGNMARTWGFTLFVKIALVGVAITAGSWNRWTILPHVDELTPRRASSGLLIEAVALVLVIAASVALTHNGPPSTQNETPTAGPVVLEESFDDVRVQLIIDPARVGTNELHLFVLDAAGTPRTVEEATVVLSSDELGIAEIEQSVTNLGAGHFVGQTDDLGRPGTWQAQVVIRPDPFSQVELIEEFEVRG